MLLTVWMIDCLIYACCYLDRSANTLDLWSEGWSSGGGGGNRGRESFKRKRHYKHNPGWYIYLKWIICYRYGHLCSLEKYHLNSKEYWMIYRGPGLLAFLQFDPTPPPSTPFSRQQIVFLSQCSCATLVEFTNGRGVGELNHTPASKPDPLYKSFNTLCSSQCSVLCSRSEEQGSGADVGAAARAGPGQNWRHVLNQEQSGTDEPDREATQPQCHIIF